IKGAKIAARVKVRMIATQGAAIGARSTLIAVWSVGERDGRRNGSATSAGIVCSAATERPFRPRLAESDAWVEPPVRPVGAQAGEEGAERDDQHQRLDYGEVARADRRDEQPADAGDGEDRLNDRRPADQEADPQSKHRHD